MGLIVAHAFKGLSLTLNDSPEEEGDQFAFDSDEDLNEGMVIGVTDLGERYCLELGTIILT